MTEQIYRQIEASKRVMRGVLALKDLNVRLTLNNAQRALDRAANEKYRAAEELRILEEELAARQKDREHLQSL